jgi:hypothetical protein
MNWFSKKNKINPLKLDWGIITADFDNIEKKEIIHVFNSDMTKKKNNNLTKSFVINKYNYYKIHLPKNRTQNFIFDLRGQNITKKESENIEKDIRLGINKSINEPELKFEFKL